jgi:hypothetical protein
MEKLQKCVNFILTVPVFFATSCKYTILSLKGSQKKIEHELTYIFIFLFLQLQSSNFKALVFSTSLVIGTIAVNVFYYNLIFTLNHRRLKCQSLTLAIEKLMKQFFLMPHLTQIQTARAIAKLEENWSLAAVARELHCSKICIFNIKRRWQENRLESPIRMGVGKVSLLKFTFTLKIHILITSQSHFY